MRLNTVTMTGWTILLGRCPFDNALSKIVSEHRNTRPNALSQCICNSVETAQPEDRTTNPDIVMPECYESSQRVDSLAGVVITPVRHTHSRLHRPTPRANICSQHTHGLNSSFFLHITCIFYCNRVGYKPIEYPTRALQARRAPHWAPM